MNELLATRLARLCAGQDGRLPKLRFHDYGARAAVMIDLAAWQRVGRDPDGALLMTTTPTGIGAVDATLAYFDRKPGRTLGDMLGRAPLHVADCVDPDRRPRWYARRMYIEPTATTTERHRLNKAATSYLDSPRTAALLLLADTLKLGPKVNTGRMLAQCAEGAWLVEECVGYLLQVRGRLELSDASRLRAGRPAAGPDGWVFT